MSATNCMELLPEGTRVEFTVFQETVRLEISSPLLLDGDLYRETFPKQSLELQPLPPEIWNCEDVLLKILMCIGELLCILSHPQVLANTSDIFEIPQDISPKKD